MGYRNSSPPPFGREVKRVDKGLLIPGKKFHGGCDSHPVHQQNIIGLFMLKIFLIAIITIILFFLISNGIHAISEIEDEDERHGAMVSQLLLLVVWVASFFLFLVN